LGSVDDLEESFYKGFAMTNEFYFECLGYRPIDPSSCNIRSCKGRKWVLKKLSI